MAAYTQEGRFMAITTPLGKDALLLDSFSGTEGMSQLFRFQLGMYSESENPVPFEKLLGQKVTVTLQGNPVRYFSGIISRFQQGHRTKGLDKKATLIRYEAEMVPQLWLLTKSVQSRIFQQLTVPDILKQVLKGIDFSSEIQGTFAPRDYCVQYGESDFAFASRLMEEEGIYYFFKHTSSSHQLVLANTPQSHGPVGYSGAIKYEEIVGGVRKDERITDWVKSQEVGPGKVTFRDHCFELPDDDLEATQPITDSVQVGTVTHKFATGANSSLEHYGFPGRYAQRFDGVDPGGSPNASNLQKIFDDKKRTTNIRMQEAALPGLTIHGKSNCRLLTPGYKFDISGHFDADGSYVVTSVEHSASIEGAFSHAGGEGQVFGNNFQCIPAGLPFRPPQQTPKARMEGPQTAMVVGPSGQEIFTDKYGRVKVQFFWDRQGKKNADSSCWIRVGTLWGGKQWGSIVIPRIGQEVVVAFEDGDPDRPIIIGSVYNANTMPPYKLPDNATQTGIMSRSSPGGGSDDFNELRMEDKKDSEEIYFQAQKDFNRVVKNNDTLKVGSSSADDGSQTIEIYKNRTETVKTGDEKVTIEQGNRTITVEQGNDTHEIKQGDRAVQIDMGNDTLTIKMGNQTTQISMGSSSTEAMQSIELTVGQSSIKLDPTGVTIQGMMISIQGQVQTQVQGVMTQISGSAMTQISGGITMIG
jgi:type VI secretion system secreted protein VgrG